LAAALGGIGGPVALLPCVPMLVR